MKIIFVTLLFSLALQPAAMAEHSPSKDGGEGGNGGQRIALEFATFGADAANLVEQNFHPGAAACELEAFSDLCTLDVRALRNAVRLAKVIAMPELSQLDPTSGKTLIYVALNFPQDQRILISEEEWQKTELCFVKKLPIVLHEYLGLLGVEIQNYRYSSLLSEWLMKTAGTEKFVGCLELKNDGEPDAQKK